MRKIYIIEPTSPEVVRANAFFLTRLAYCALSEHDCTSLFTDVTVQNMAIILDDLSQDEWEIVISLWSETQIDTALSIYKMSYASSKVKKVSFIGFNPIMKKYGLPLFTEKYDDLILQGMKRQWPLQFPKNMYEYITNKNIGSIPEIEDCDSHTIISDGTFTPKSGKEPFQPLITSLGCPMGCKFCKATVFQPRTISLGASEVLELLRDYNEGNVRYFHIFDDNFLADTKRAIKILYGASIINPNFKFIFLSTLFSLNKFEEELKNMDDQEVAMSIYRVIHLVEVGLETVNPEINKSVGKDKPKGSIEPEKVVTNRFDVFWLTITFLPGETIKSLNETGSFLRNFGLRENQLLDRMKTASTELGLGQFFAPYDGTGIDMGKLSKLGIFLFNPLRTIPSYIPYSFLNSRFVLSPFLIRQKKAFPHILDKIARACKRHGFEVDNWIYSMEKGAVYSVSDRLNELSNWGFPQPMQIISTCVTIALMARASYIIPAE